MYTTEKIELIKKIDSIACEANNLWHQVESLKMSLIKSMMLPEGLLKKAGVYIPEKEEARNGK